MSNKIGEFLREKKLYCIWFVIAAVMLWLDRFTKYLVVNNMELNETINLIKVDDTEVLNLYYCLNTGAAFSKFSGQRVLLIVFTSAVIVGLLVLMLIGKIKRPIYIAAISLVISGGIGNLIDRIFNHGQVVDFIDVRLIDFAIFNVADICAVVGACLVLLGIILDERKTLKKKDRLTEDANGDGKA